MVGNCEYKRFAHLQISQTTREPRMAADKMKPKTMLIQNAFGFVSRNTVPSSSLTQLV